MTIGTYSCSPAFLKNHTTNNVNFQVENDISGVRVTFVLKEENSSLSKTQTKIPSDTAYFEYKDDGTTKKLITNKVISEYEMSRFLTAVGAQSTTLDKIKEEQGTDKKEEKSDKLDK